MCFFTRGLCLLSESDFQFYKNGPTEIICSDFGVIIDFKIVLVPSKLGLDDLIKT